MLNLVVLGGTVRTLVGRPPKLEALAPVGLVAWLVH